jgi:hypothetical protein
MLTPTLPYPPDSGGNIRLYHLAKRLSSAFEIPALPRLPPQSADHELALKAEHRYCDDPPRREDRALEPPRRLWRRVDFWQYSPHSISLDMDPHYAKRLKQLLRRYRFHVAVVVNLYMFRYRKYFQDFPVFYNANDIESVKYRWWYGRDSLSSEMAVPPRASARRDHEVRSESGHAKCCRVRDVADRPGALPATRRDGKDPARPGRRRSRVLQGESGGRLKRSPTDRIHGQLLL